jgi:hypothetical protein
MQHTSEPVAIVHDDVWCKSSAMRLLPEDDTSVHHLLEAYQRAFLARHLDLDIRGIPMYLSEIDDPNEISDTSACAGFQ